MSTSNRVPKRAGRNVGKKRHFGNELGPKNAKKQKVKEQKKRKPFPKARYQKLEKIGEGSYGLVYKAMNTVTNEIVAIKEAKMDFQEGVPYSTVRETSILKTLDHPAIVKLLAVQCTRKPKKSLHLFFEFCQTDLRKYLEGFFNAKQYISLRKIKQLSYQLFSGILYLHKRGLFHRDLKPVNLLLDEKENLKIADFGLAREFSIPVKALTPKVVTLCYRCPEILLGKEAYGGGVDVWSMGCIVAELFSTDIFLDGDCDFGQLMKIFRVTGTPNQNLWEKGTKLPHYCTKLPKWKPCDLFEKIPNLTEDAENLIRGCLELDPSNRLTAEQGLAHSFFDDIRDVAFDTDIASQASGDVQMLSQDKVT